jgi:glycosyltransferase involved in cell wall biosynthesis
MSDFARGLVARGHEVTVFTTDVLDAEHRALPRSETLDGVQVERFANLSNTLAWRTKKYVAPGLVAAAARRIGRFDVVHATDARTLATAAGYLGARAARVPFCLSAHGSLPGSSGLRGAIKGAFDRVLVRPMLDRAALLLAQTDHETALYEGAGGRPGSIRLLPLPVDLAAIPEAHPAGFLRERGDFAPDVPIALFLGRIHQLKGLDLLVGALEPLLEAGELALAVAGRDDGAWDDIAARHGRLLAAGALRFVGPLYGDERFHAYADADVFCLTPRHWEETSVAVLEAAAVGTPVVVTEQTDVPGLAESGGGFVVPLDANAIAVAVRRVLVDPAAMGKKAREHVRRQHDRDAVVAQLEAHLLEALARWN